MHRSVSSRAVLAIALVLSGCALTDTQKKWAGIAAAVIVTGAVIAHQQDDGKPNTDGALNDPTVPCRVQPDGSCR
jgi:hypothetical protein